MAATALSARFARPRVAGVLVVSLLFHGLVLTPLALNLWRDVAGRPAVADQHPIYLDIAPRPRLRDEPRAPRMERPPAAVDPTTRLPRPPLPTERPLRDDARPAATPENLASLPATTAPDDRWRVRPSQSDARIPESLRRSAAGCRTLSDRLDPAERARCDQAFAAAAARAGPIQGTADPARDARFAALGDQALADYDRRRAPLKPNSRANPCPEGPDPGDPCAFAIKGRLWSSRDGFLPDLPGRQ